MVRDEISRLAGSGSFGSKVKSEMSLRGYEQWKDGTWHHREMPNVWMTDNAASCWIATRMDNFNDGFDAGMEWCLMQLRAYKYKGDAIKRIEEELKSN